MLRSLYTAATGMEAQQTKMDVIAHNLANTNTTGFKRSRAEFEDLLSETIRSSGPPNAQGSTISVPQGAIPTISERGEVVVDGSTVDTLGTFKLQGPIDRNGNALFTPGAGASVEAVEGKMQVGTLELGNVPALESTVAMIGAQRHFETAMQAIQTYKKLDEKATEVGKVR